MTPTPGALLLAFKRMSPRAAQVVQRASLDGLGLGALARKYGVSQRAAGVLLLRSVRELDAALGGTEPRPLPYEFELASLPAFLEGWRRADPFGPAALLVASTAAREELSVALAAAAAAEEASPRRRREGWLRWLAIIAILALSAYLYWRDEVRRPTPTPHLSPR